MLGQFEVFDERGRLELGGRKQRALLAYLALRRGEVVSGARLVDELWGEHPPAAPAKSVHVYVSRLRKALGDGLLARRAGGYVLDLDRGTLDLDRFEELRAEARSHLDEGRPREAADRLHAALGLWRGPPLADLEHEPALASEIARLDDLRLVTLEERLEAELAAGLGATLVPELEALVRAHPLRERLCAQLMRALYAAGRQADALAAYRACRVRLGEELGLEPGPELQQLERAILVHDPALAPAPRTKQPPARHGRRLLVAGTALLAAALAGIAYALASGGGSAGLAAVAPNRVALIDGKTNRLVAEVPVGARPGAIAASGTSLWVANLDDATISRVDARARRVLRTIAVGGAPVGLTATPASLWVTTDTNQLARIDPQFDTISPAGATLIRGDYGYSAQEQRPVAAGHGSLWLASPLGVVSRISADGSRRLAQIEVGNGATAVVFGAGSIWVTNRDDGTVSRIDPTGVATATVPVGHGPAGIAFGHGSVWVADSLDGVLVRIDAATNAVTARIRVGRSPAAVAASGDAVWVANAGSGTVDRVDPRSNRVVAKVDIGGRPSGLAVTDDGVWTAVQAAPPAPRGGGVLRVHLQADPYTPLDPALAQDLVSWQILYATCAKLLNYRDAPAPAGSTLLPEVAESAPLVSADGRTYTFTVRRGFHFSPPSNDVVTARSFERALERALSPRVKSGAAGLFLDVVGAREYHSGRARRIAGVAVHRDRLSITLNAPVGDFAARVALPALCAVPADAPIAPRGIATLPAAGPYYVASYAPGAQIVLARNPRYRGARPHRFDQIVITVGTSQAQATREVERGEADYAAGGVPLEARGRLAAAYGPGSEAAREGRQRYFVNPSLIVRYLILNTSRPLFADPQMRRAVAAVLDRRALAAEVVKHLSSDNLGGGFATDQLLAPGLPGAAPRSPPAAPRLDVARRLARGRGGTALMHVCNHSPCAQIGRIVQRDLARIGIDVRVEELPTGVMFGRALARNSRVDMLTFAWVPDYPDPANVLNLLFAEESNFAHFRDGAYALALRAAAQLSGPRRYRAYADLARRLAVDAVPAIAYEVDAFHDFFSARVGCQVFQPAYGIDLTALCLR